WALVDRLAIGDGFGVGFAAGVAALAALGLGQQCVDLLDHGIACNPEADRGIAQQRAEDQRQGQQNDYRGKDERHAQIRISPVKPMKARDMSPAVIMPMAAPRKGAGTSAMAKRSRNPANRISTMEKPIAAPR